MKNLNSKINKKDRLVKYNKKKIIIVTSIVITLIVGISLGIYFAVRKPANKFAPNVSRKSHSAVRKILQNSTKNPNKIYGLYLNDTSSTTDNNVIYGAQDENGNWNKQDTAGDFSTYTKTTDKEFVEWVSISKSNASDIALDASKAFYGTDTKAKVALDDVNTMVLGPIGDTSFEDDIRDATIGGDVPNGLISSSSSSEDDNLHNLVITANGEEKTIGGSTWFFIKNGAVKLTIMGVDDSLEVQDINSEYWKDAEDWVSN